MVKLILSILFFVFMFFFVPMGIVSAEFETLDELVEASMIAILSQSKEFMGALDAPPEVPQVTRQEIADAVARNVDKRITNIDSMERFTILDSWLLGLAGNIDEEHEIGREMAGVYYRSRAEWLWERRRGTSQDSAVLTYYVLQEAHSRAQHKLDELFPRDSGYEIKLEQPDIRILSNAEHDTRTEDAYHFVVWTNPAEEGQVRDANDPTTWGEDAVVVDGRTGKALPADKAAEDKYYSVEEENKLSDATLIFDEERADDGQWRGRGRGGGFLPLDCLFYALLHDTPQAGHIAALRQFRDEVLFTSAAGRACVTFYYRHSPLLANIVFRHHVLRHGFRIVFVKPLVTMVQWIG